MTSQQQDLHDEIQGGKNVTTMSTTSIHVDGDTSFEKYISDEAFKYIIISMFTAGNGVIAVVGIVTNIINIVVFIKQGVFSDSSTVSLFGLAVADLLSVATALWVGVMFCVALLEPPGLNWSPYEVMYMTGAWPHLVVGLITRMINALIAFERCFCVVFPFKVRNVFTPRSSAVMVSITFAYYILTYTPVYFLNTFHYVKDPKTNMTRFTLVEHPDWQTAQYILSTANIYALNFISVIIVLICTTITISRVKISSAWRDSAVTGNQGKQQIIDGSEKANSQNNKLSSTKMQKEKKLIRMITLISVLFLVSYMPSISLPIIYNYNREIRTDGLYQNLSWTMFFLCWVFETVNSSINLFIYYRMSSKFRSAFNELFGISEE